MGSRTSAWVAWAVCGLSLALTLCSGLLALLTGRLAESAFSIVQLSNALVGGVDASRRPHNPVGWLFLAAGLAWSFQVFASQYAIYSLMTEPGALPFARTMAWLSTWTGPLGALLMFLILPLYFPNGRLVSPRWRPVAWLAVINSVADLVLIALMPGEVTYEPRISNPLGVEALRPVRDLLEAITLVLFLGLVLVSVSSLVVRFLRSAAKSASSSSGSPTPSRWCSSGSA